MLTEKNFREIISEHEKKRENLWFRTYDDTVTFVFYRFPNMLRDLRASVKYGLQRMFRGYDNSDWWDYKYNNTERNIKLLTKLRENKNGYPIEFVSDDRSFEESRAEWDKVLEKIIEGFKAFRDSHEVFIKDEKGEFDYDATRREEERLKKIWRRSMNLYIKYYENLWD